MKRLLTVSILLACSSCKNEPMVYLDTMTAKENAEAREAHWKQCESCTEGKMSLSCLTPFHALTIKGAK